MSEFASPDYELNIQKGRKGLFLLLFVIGLKIVLGVAVGSIENIIYVVPFFLVLIAAIQYYSWNTFALYAGLIIAALEIIDYTVGTIANFVKTSSISLPFVIVFIGLRISAFSLIFTALKWKIKQKNAAGNAAGLEHPTNPLPDPPPVIINDGDTWTCKECDQINPATASTCKGCGEYK